MVQETELVRKPVVGEKRAADLAPNLEFFGGLALAHRSEADTEKGPSERSG